MIAIRPAAALAVLAALAGCADELEEPQKIRNLRILGVRAEPAEAPVGVDLALEVLVTDRDRTAAIETLWLACVTPSGGVAPESCLPLFDAPPPPLCSADPEAPLCAIGFGGAAEYRVPARARMGRAPDENGQILFTVVSALTAEGGLEGCLADFQDQGVMPTFCRIAVKRFAVLPDGVTANLNPGFDDMVVSGEDVSVVLTPSSIEETPDGPETPFISWFVTEGDVGRYRTDADEDGLTNTWTLDQGAGRIFAVIRDGRGGEGWVVRSR